MTVSHCIASIDTTTGGPARSVTHLVSSLAQADSALQLTLHTGASSQPIVQRFKNSNASLIFYEGGFLGRFKGFKTQLDQEPPNLLHGHGLWQQPVHQMAGFARRYGIPYIITPRGMLEPWSLTQSKFKKQLALRLYQSRDLRDAACLHATAPMEAQQFRALGFKNPIAVIPNGIDLTSFPVKEFLKEKEQKTVLFLSRIHPKKGIELLIEAWSRLDAKVKYHWKVEIAGNGEASYINSLRQLIQEKNLEADIKITGPLFGAAKLEAYHRADLFVLPTYSENFGIVVAEALAGGTPVITTQGTPWQDLETHGCGWWINTGAEALTHSLETALQLEDRQLRDMGLKGRRLIEDHYSITAVAQQMSQLYRWILNPTNTPDFVSLN